MLKSIISDLCLADFPPTSRRLWRRLRTFFFFALPALFSDGTRAISKKGGMRKHVTTAIGFAMCSISFVVHAEVTSEIELVSSYTEYGGGDVVFTTTIKGDGCYGYWLSPAHPGFKSAYAMLISAYHMHGKVALTADTVTRWPGSSNLYCKVIRANLVR